MRMREGAFGASILSTVGSRREPEALPEFNRSIHKRYGSKISGSNRASNRYGAQEEVEVGSINLASSQGNIGFDTNKVRMTPIPSMPPTKIASPTVGGKTPTPNGGVKLTRYVNFDRTVAERSVSRSRQQDIIMPPPILGQTGETAPDPMAATRNPRQMGNLNILQ